ncbi:MFS transporter [Streptomyces qinzhouensis]|uniref:MFS transporter n=1 Tax=Streptomyces qinzhouensis TaxID=2599401 RepID=UPI001FE5634A|nr:MFS transporter [Streptomyces qinzhouensis]
MEREPQHSSSSHGKGLGTDPGERPARDPRRWWILVVLCLSTLVLVIDNMVLTVAVPAITDDLDASTTDVQWIIESYILVFAGLLLTAGSLSDRFGRRKVMILGLALFGAASLVATYAGSPETLIAARVLMGVGGALVMPSTLSILITVFDEDERPKAIAAWSGVAMVGLVGGPVLGGALIADFWWGAVFLINVPIAALAIGAALLLMPESKGPWRKPDVPGMLLSMTGMTALVWTIIEAPKTGLGDPVTLTTAIAAVVSLAAFVIWEARTEAPMVPVELFRNKVFTGASFSLVLLTFANGGLMLVLTQYLQFVLGYSATETGLAFAPMAVAVIAFNGIGAALLPRTGNRVMAVIGLLTIAAGFGALATLSEGDGWGLLSVAMLLMGAGGGLAMPAAIAALMGAVPEEHAGVGSALNDTIQQAGAALGVAILGAVLSGTYRNELPDDAPEAAKESVAVALKLPGLADAARDAFTQAMSNSFVAGGIGVVAAAVLAAVLLRGREPGQQPEQGQGQGQGQGQEPVTAEPERTAAH